MNDRHPSGISPSTVPAQDASYSYDAAYGLQQDTAHGYGGYDGYSTGSFDQLGTAYGDGDPLFGALPGSYDGEHSGQYDASQWTATGQHHTGQHHTGQYDTGQHHTGQYDTGQYDTGAYDTTAMWAASGYQLPTDIPAQRDAETGAQWDIGAWDANATGQWNTGTGYETYEQHEAYEQPETYDASGADTGQTQFWDTSAYATVDGSRYEQPGFEHTRIDQPAFDQPAFDEAALDQAALAQAQTATFDFSDLEDKPAAPEAEPEPGAAAEHEQPAPAPRRDGSRGRRRTTSSRATSSRTTTPRPRRSALLTVAVPSVCALGVTAVAAASVSGIGSDTKDNTTTQAAADTAAAPVKPSTATATAANSKLDSQLAGVSEGADDFRDRASRTQERIDLQARQAAEKKRRIQEAVRKEALRPKFAIPVAQHGLSATFGQAGINWMSVHTGIDFPVSYGTPVMAATDGTVRTQWNDAYGNMVIMTSPDGTETWYCHLSSTKIRSGTVQAGDTIAYSGNSGNSTGPHLHFEVHPGGGAAIDPLPWLRSHGLDPT
ncbi:M23 family metallopeptidase [Streptomyces sp. NPDC005355]|uniref:M23 family metallopeptidase n=1 Tax=Streptomyces sp. NPDC005355 TaxID=3157038 RepID=UPI0033B5B118